MSRLEVQSIRRGFLLEARRLRSMAEIFSDFPHLEALYRGEASGLLYASRRLGVQLRLGLEVIS